MPARHFLILIQSEAIRSRVAAALTLMQQSFSQIAISELGKKKRSTSDWVLTDVYEPEQVLRLASRLGEMGIDPRHQLIRLIDHAWSSHFYHDLPLFASVVVPPTALDLKTLLDRLLLARHRYENSGRSSDHAATSTEQARDPLDAVFTRSSAMQRVVSQLQKIAKVPVDTVLLGPTGAGKDTIAQWLHRQSGAKGAFVHINCAALPESLFESELFGVAAGAFTGAVKDRPGKLELADQGTLYLDEIDSLSLACQAKLLTALQYRGAQRLGGSEFYPSQFRVIASTKVDFPELVKQGRFREDLHFRLSVSQITIPALRDRPEDILPLFTQFLQDACEQYQVPTPELSAAWLDTLLGRAWLGNVRELRGFAQRVALQLETNTLGSAMSDCEQHHDNPLGLKDRLAGIERAMIMEGLQRCGNSSKKAAEALGIPLHSFYYRAKRLGLDVSSFHE